MIQLGYWLQIFSELGGVGVIAWAVRNWTKYLEHKKETHQKTMDGLHQTDNLLKAGVVAMLHHELYANCTKYLKNEYVTPGQLNDLEYIFSSYKDLGGNGTGEVLYNKVRALSIKEEE
ncbi:hypothetical protein [Liquorilactobacillus satsumensis]|uniref:hypothetical protein n=1 Tax=Liquorilactobacillus satsumensis TaxID=259059 RepID=UPI000704A55B|nr:hypothetical protein [Liquorilactobacillus satsumensis]